MSGLSLVQRQVQTRRCTTCGEVYDPEHALQEHTLPRHLPSNTVCAAATAALGYCVDCNMRASGLEHGCLECGKAGGVNGMRELRPC